MNGNEIARLAAAISLLRPDWHVESLRTFITEKLATRPYRDAAVALAWVACESESQTPARALSPGPWWKAGSEDPGPQRSSRCQHCGTIHTAGGVELCAPRETERRTATAADFERRARDAIHRPSVETEALHG